MGSVSDRRSGAIRTRNKPSTITPPFQPVAEKAVAGGYASLDELNALVPVGQLGTGTPSGNQALMGDQTWQDVATPADVAAEATARAAADSAEMAARVAADAAHVAAVDPHTQYQRESEKNGAGGYAGLDGSSKLAGAQQVYGTGANTACEGNDARLSDSRAPNGAAGGVLAGTYPNPSFAVDMATQAELDAKFESGSWTPADASAAALVFTTAIGRFYRIGKMYFCFFSVTYPVTASGIQARIGGLPATTRNQGGEMMAVQFSYYGTAFALLGLVSNGNTYFRLYKDGSGGTQALNSDMSTIDVRGCVIFEAA